MTAGVMRRLRNYFVTGLLVILPSVVTGYVLWKVFVWVDGILGKLIARYLGYNIPGVGFVATVVAVWFIGLLASNFIGRRLIALGEWILRKIPLVNKIYIGVQQIASVMLREKRPVFQRAVMIEYPRRGVYSVAFVTNRTETEFPVEGEKMLVTLFLPTTPNPTSGFLLIMPEDDVIDLSMSVEEAIKLIISGGSVLPTGLEGDVRAKPPRRRRAKS